jgi:CheY-like chemotaxis protein
LLAEDNPVNVEVASAMLEGLGLDVSRAANGAEALDAVRGGDFDLVLMDCHMPVMDGMAATAEIRRHEQQHGSPQRLPVVAITANALPGDRETCLAAGMDDYLSKPFTQQGLGEMLAHWITLPRSAPAQWADEPGAQALVAASSTLNLTALSHIRALSPDKGEALLARVIGAFLGDTPPHLEALRRAVAAPDPAAIRRTAHSLKSSSANVGADALALLCKELEQLGRAGLTDGASTLLAAMEKEFRSVRQSLGAILEKET